MRDFVPFLVALYVLGGVDVIAWLSSSSASRLLPSKFQQPRKSALWGGFGVATDYKWTEEPFELEVTVQVPPETRAKDIKFKASVDSIDLRLQNDDTDVVLLDKNRKLRGRVSLDGTYWVISDSEDDPTMREITVTIEKLVKTPKDDFEIIDYDWKGVYPDDDEEVKERKYEEPEELDVREYAASLGVDIDNINMSMVDKTMFSSGLNLTRSSMDELSKAGVLQEVTQQSDGTEYVTNEEGEAVPFSQLGDSVGEDEIREASKQPQIPFLDTSSPWHQTSPVEDRDIQFDKKTGVPELINSGEDEQPRTKPNMDKLFPSPAASDDPIDALKVQRLKEILREQGLKVSGTKQELRDRLREHVQTRLGPKQQDSDIEQSP